MMSKFCEQMHMKLICMLGSEGQAAGEEIKAQNDGGYSKVQTFSVFISDSRFAASAALVFGPHRIRCFQSPA